jgi:tripartite-type tricarboxylate transporter receptor subunit TctC
MFRRRIVPTLVASLVGAALMAGIMAGMAVPANAADQVADFYAGKTLRVLVGFAPGGGYDLYARTLARYLGKYIPGEPTVVAQNMPGAGSLKVLNYLYNAAPRDGTAIAIFARGIVFEPLLGHTEGTQFDAARLNWIGSISNEVGVCALMTASGITSWTDMQTRPFRIGASGVGADSDIFPVVLRNLFHLPMQLVAGYQGGAEMVLAMQRHEIDGRCGWSWTSLVSRDKALYDAHDITVTLQIALARHEDLPNVPLVMDLVDDPQKLAALKLIVSRQNIARPFAAPPEVPVARVAALRQAFDAVMRDPDFLAEAGHLGLEVRPVGGAQVQSLFAEVYASPPDVVARAAELIKGAP